MPTNSKEPSGPDLSALIELKKASKDPKDKQRLPVLKETLRQLKGTL